MKTYVVKYENKRDFVNIPINKINDSKSILIQIFSGICDKDVLNKLVLELKEIFPKAHIIGSTTDGEIIDGEITTKKIIVSISSFEKSEIKTAYVENVTQRNSYQKGKELANFLISENSKVIISFCDGLHTNGEEFAKGVNTVCKDIVLSGGLAGDNAKFQKTFVICNDKVMENGAVGAVLINKNLIVSTDYRFGWIPVGKKLKITSSVGNRVYRIDNMKAVDAYRHYLGEETASMLPKTGIEFPLITIRNGMEIARAVISKNDDGSLDFAGNIQIGEYYQFGLGNADLIINSVSKSDKKLKNRAIEGVFVYSCMARRRFLQNAASIELSYLSSFGRVSGFFTYGEFFHVNSKKNEFLNETMTVLALSENPKSKESKKETFNAKKIDEDYIRTLKALSHLITVTNNELEHIHEIVEYERNIFVQGPVIVVKIDANDSFSVDYVSPNVINHIGYSSFDFISEKILFKDIILKKDFNRLGRRILEAIKKGLSFFEEEFRIVTKDNKIKVFDAYILIDRDEKGKVSCFNGYLLDVTKRKEMEYKLEYLAYHDVLTGLPNRAYFKEKIDYLLDIACCNRVSLGFIYFDLNGFKDINDTLGHHIGDELLRIVANKIKDVIRGEDLFLRLGGDEFLIILTFLDRERAKESIKGFSKRIFDIFKNSFIIGNHKISVSTSMGASIFPQDSKDINDILKFSDKAMYIAKRMKKGEVIFYEDIKDEASKERVRGKFLIKDTI